jgi:RNA polymerase sigma-54 factor
MQLALRQEARLEQTLCPRLIQYYELLACPLPELEAEITRQVAENPALEVLEEPAEPPESAPAEPWRLRWSADEDGGEDAVARLPAPVSLRDHLRWHFLALCNPPEQRRLGLQLIDELDDDGYLRTPIGELAMRLQVSVLAVEAALEAVWSLDPPGVGARDLRECLLLQLRQLALSGGRHALAQRLLEECWEDFSARRLPACARRLRASPLAVSAAAEFISRHCQPYPGRRFTAAWQPASAPARPEVAVRDNPGSPPPYRAAVVETRRLQLTLDRTYRDLDQAVRAGAALPADEAEHVQALVRAARTFIASLNQRSETVRRVTELAANEQADFVARGPQHLKPLTRIAVARRLGLHESTVGRAVAGKHVELPSREVVRLDAFFDGGQPLRAAIEQLLAAEDKGRPLSDQQLADRLAALGFDVARRTVAKYRGLLKVPGAARRRTI